LRKDDRSVLLVDDCGALGEDAKIEALSSFQQFGGVTFVDTVGMPRRLAFGQDAVG
jgi:hypothetical protein